MRKILITLLMASAAATPALAAGPRHDSDRQQTREDRQQAREESRAERQAPVQRVDRQSEPRAQSNQRAERPQFNQQAERPQLQQRADRPQQAYQAPARIERNLDAVRADNARREALNAARDQRVQGRTQVVQQLRDERGQTRDQRIDARELRQASRPQAVRNHPPVVSRVPRPGTQPPLQTEGRHTPQVQWNTNWRSNHHYDWQNRRHHNRSLFHLGFYYDPYGWGYQPFSIGWRMWPSYYGRNYWIDPAMYGLPYAPPGYAWVRYWNDAMLVDTWSGQVVDMIPNFFW
jgi:nickel/cobalt transporter regulator